MRRMAHGLMAVVACAVMGSCGGSGGGGRNDLVDDGATEITIAGSPATDGVFDAAPASHDKGTLWMSHSIVLTSPHAATLNQVRTRVARSRDGGATWNDVGADPNRVSDPDIVVLDTHWATWRFEVSRLVYDPYDSDAGARWKMLWHRILAVDLSGDGTPTPENSWIGYATAADPAGPWSTERKLFTGSLYNPALDSIIGAPEFPLASHFPGASQMGNCAAFTEPGVLARADGIYVSLQCGGGGKLVLLRCDRAFTSCNYLGDLLADGEAAAFADSAHPINGFAATELVESGSAVYLIVTGYDTVSAAYHGCLVFQVSDLASARVERASGHPVLVKRVEGKPAHFNGACGYDGGATASGIIYSEYIDGTSPRYHLYASHEKLP